MKTSLVNWVPWSVLKMSGRPPLRASYRASTQKPTSRVLERRQETTYRLHQSMMSTRYRNPRVMGTQVISAVQT